MNLLSKSQCMGFLYWLCVRSTFFAALSALSFPYKAMWLGIQVRKMLFLEREFILIRNL